MRWLHLEDNDLEGPVPAELGNLRNVWSLRLDQNDLDGPVPTELGDLTNLEYLWLSDNDLEGHIPTELGNLSNLRRMDLSDNGLEGHIPTELGRLSNLRWLHLARNAGLTGQLPDSLTNLQQLTELLIQGTDLCAPRDDEFLTWLQSVPEHRVALCDGAESITYLTQAVQSRQFPVPLVAGREALLRVFVTATRSTSEGIPPVRATFFLDDEVAYEIDIAGQSTTIPTEIDESMLSKSANARIPRWVLRSDLGLEMVVEVDPEGTLDSSLGVKRRIPETGRLALDVRAMPTLDLTLIPFVWAEDPDSTIVDLIQAMAADPENHELLQETRTLLPTRDVEVTAYEPVLTSTNNSGDLLAVTYAIRVIEGGPGHYMGMMSGYVAGSGGIAEVAGRVSFSIPDGGTMAHELGHNMSLRHAPCGVQEPDPEFPRRDGSIGAWGYDFRDQGRLVDPATRDLMSYCTPRWISDYHFRKALLHRLEDEGDPTAALTAPVRSLLLWGGSDADGDLFLEPTFVVDAPPALPGRGGDYQLEGFTEDGRQLFVLNFDMREDSEGRSTFAFALPVQPDWAGDLARVRLSSNNGSVTLDRESAPPSAILLDRQSGQVRGILRDLPATLRRPAEAASVFSPDSSMDVLFSRGIPDVISWRR